LPLQVGVDVAQLARHVVEGRRQILDLVAAVDLDGVVEVAASHPANP